MIPLKTGRHKDEIIDYIKSILTGKKNSCKEEVLMAERFVRDLKNDAYEFKARDADFVIDVIQNTFKHDKGDTIDGDSLRGKPFILEPWQKAIVYNLLGFFHKGTVLRKFKEAFIMIPRKNGKTRFISALAWGLSILESEKGSSIYIVAASLRQSSQSFDFIKWNLKEMGVLNDFKVLDNNQEKSIKGELGNGLIEIEALANNPDRHDSLNSNIQILDELHAYKSPKNYNVIKESGKAYSNRLCIGITTAGDNINS